MLINQGPQQSFMLHAIPRVKLRKNLWRKNRQYKDANELPSLCCIAVEAVETLLQILAMHLKIDTYSVIILP